MNCNENCRFFHRMLNKENIRKYGKSFCMFWHEYKCEGKPCRDFIPKEEENEVKNDYKPKFTPGPWTAVQHGGGIYTWTIRGNDSIKERALAIVGVGAIDFERDMANMHLIKAAPEMYEMLASIRTTLKYMGYLPYLVKDIDLILRKARGESEVSE